jgi:hypothetical protein
MTAMPRERIVDQIEERTVIDEPRGPLVGWGPVFGGFFVGAGVVLLLSVLGVAIGVTVLPDPRMVSPEGTARLGLGAAVWAAVSLLIGFFIGGWVAARGANHPDRAGAVIQGMLLWTLGIIAVVALVTSGISAGVSGLFHGLGLLTRGAIVSSFATATGTSTGEAARALDDLRARLAPIGDDPVRVAAEVKSFFAQSPERRAAESAPSADAAAVQRGTRIGSWITLGTLLITLFVSLAGALAGAPAPDRWRGV